MRRAGYPAHKAAAIEAVASTGGQLAPPVMGATAFLMAEYLGIPYLSVVSAALVPAAIYYGKPLHLQSAYSNLGGREGDCPVAERCAKSVFSLPMHPYLTMEEADRVITALLS